MAKQVSLKEVDQLSSAEKILLVQDLWDRVADDPEAWPLTAAQKRELERREAKYQRDKKAGRSLGVSWQETKRRVRRKK